MGRIRSGLGDAFVGKRPDHLDELCNLMKDPNTSVKQLNMLYALRTAWASRGYLLDRELMIIRTTSTGEYISRAEQRAAKPTYSASARVAEVTTLSRETFFSVDKETIIPPPESVSENNVVIPETKPTSRKKV